MDKLNQEIADFFNLDKSHISNNENHILVENNDNLLHCDLQNNGLDNFNIINGIHIKLFRRDGLSFATLGFYENGICTTEYLNFEYDEIQSEYDYYINDHNKKIQFKTLSFISLKTSRVLKIQVTFEDKCQISVGDYLLKSDLDDVISNLLNTSKAEIDLDGVTHYILKNIDNKLVVDSTPIDKWDDDLLKDCLVLDFCYTDQTIGIQKYHDNQSIGMYNFVVRNIERNDNTLIIYPIGLSSRFEIVLEPILKIRRICCLE